MTHVFVPKDFVPEVGRVILDLPTSTKNNGN
jgi:hypothetical protein